LVYDGALKESKLYDQAVIIGNEIDMDETFHAMWKSIDEFGEEGSILYPTGLLEMLE